MIPKCDWLVSTFEPPTEADKRQFQNIFSIRKKKSEKNTANRNVFGKSFSYNLSNLKDYCKP